MLDSARALDNRQYYRRFIDFIADRGADTLLWHFSDDQGCAIQFDTLPAASPNAYSKREAADLAAYARSRGINLIPELATLGHTRYITGGSSPFVELAETEQYFSSISPVAPRSRELIGALLDEVIDVFDSPLIHVGLDEVNLGGHPLTAAALKTQSAGELFADYVRFLHGRVTASGRRMMMWGDFLLKDPAVAAAVPKDILVANWKYDPEVTIESTKQLAAHGFEVVACPALISYNQPLAAGESWAYPNVREMASHRRREPKVVGTITTIWTPTRFLSETLWPSVDYAAALMRGGQVAVRDQAKALGERFFGMPEASTYADAMVLLARIAPRRSAWLPTAQLQSGPVATNTELDAHAEQFHELASLLASCRPAVRANLAAFESLQLMAETLAHAWARAVAYRDRKVVSSLIEASEQLSARLAAAWDQERFADDPRKHAPASSFDDGDHLRLAFDQGTTALRAAAGGTPGGQRSSSIRLGVVGLGIRSNLADIAHRQGTGARVTHVCDLHPAKREAAWQRFGPDVRFSTDVAELVKDADIDAVMVLSPDWLHADHAVAAMEAGKAVFLEKPMATTIEDCDRILATAARCGVKLYVGHNMRHMDFVLKMKELIDKGAIGQVQTAWERHFISYGGDAYYRDWHADRRYSTGLLLQKAAHDLDVMHWLCGGYTQRVQAMGRLSVYNRVEDRATKTGDFEARWDHANWPPLASRNLNPVIDVEDLSLLNAQLDNGVLIAYQQCHYTPDEQRNFTFIGDAGRIESVKDEQGRWVIRLWNRRSDRHRPDGDERFVLEPQSGGHGGADPVMIRQFLAYLRGETDPSCSPLAARTSVAAGYQATQSIRQGGAVLDVPPVTTRYA